MFGSDVTVCESSGLKTDAWIKLEPIGIESDQIAAITLTVRSMTAVRFYAPNTPRTPINEEVPIEKKTFKSVLVENLRMSSTMDG